ncbi:portal protein [Pseudoalteromonas phage J2-1_QLiu-2017]|nr:portal protein [Pseudoalteromonas phage J2-1_QLiu-2017]
MKKYESRRSRRAKQNSQVQKATREQRTAPTQQSTVAIDFIKRVTNIIRPYELSRSQRFKTFEAMLLDDAVFTAYDATVKKVVGAYKTPKIKANILSEDSLKAKEFLEWNIENLNGTSLTKIARACADLVMYGVSPFEKIYEKGYDEWTTTPDGKPVWKLASLSYIHPLTLDTGKPFLTNKGSRKITHWRQVTTAFNNESQVYYKNAKDGAIEIPTVKVCSASYNNTDSNPLSFSPFDAAYNAWREKQFLQDATITGVSKDFAGTPILYIPANILERAQQDPTSDEAIMVDELQEAMAAMHTGDMTNVILPSNPFNEAAGSSARQFEIKFQGVEGKGKQFNVDELIEQRRRAIFGCFGATHLLAGENQGGYNQLTGQTVIHAEYVEYICDRIDEMFNLDVIPQLFRLNEWKLTRKDTPKIGRDDLAEVSYDEVGKFIQRVGATGFLPKTPKVINHILNLLEVDEQIDESMSQEDLKELLGEETTRAGDGMKEGMGSGTGSANGKSGNASDMNSDNTA